MTPEELLEKMMSHFSENEAIRILKDAHESYVAGAEEQYQESCEMVRRSWVGKSIYIEQLEASNKAVVDSRLFDGNV